ALVRKAPQDRDLKAQLALARYRAGRWAEAAALYDDLRRGALASQIRALPHPYRILSGGKRWEIPFQSTDPLPVIKARVNGGPEHYFILDTGAADTILDPSLADEANALRFGAEPGLFAGGRSAPVERGR